jgi:hypothetical protein
MGEVSIYVENKCQFKEGSVNLRGEVSIQGEKCQFKGRSVNAMGEVSI